MAYRVKMIVMVIIAIGVIAGLAALLWPRKCTPDVNCAEYKDINTSIYK